MTNERPDLDAMIEAARSLQVGQAAASARARQIAASVSRETLETRSWRRHWKVLVAAGATAAVAAAVIALIVSSGERPDSVAAISINSIGERVAISASDDAVFSIESGPAATTIRVANGRLSARLFPGDHSHALTLRGAGVVASATGTTFSIEVRDSKATVHVHHGSVEVTSDQNATRLAAGDSFPKNARLNDEMTRAAAALEASPPPDLRTPSIEPLRVVDAGPTDAPANTPEKRSPPLAAADGGAAQAPTEGDLASRWKRAREHRADGEPTAALAELDRIIAARDATWTPIAIVEAMRIRAALGHHRRVRTLGTAYLKRYPKHGLQVEAIELICAAAEALQESAAPAFCVE